MEVKDYLEKKKIIQKTFIDYVDDGNHASFQRILRILTDLNIDENPREMKPILQILNSIANNYHRTPEFFTRIEKILLRNYRGIKRTLSNKGEFDNSTLNKRIVFFLIQEGYMALKDCQDKSTSFVSFFYPELEQTLSNNLKEELKEKFEDLRGKINLKKIDEFRKIGENNSLICSLIRSDSIDDFISYVNQENISLSSSIKRSVFETNPFLFDKEVSLIEYAAFFGSIQIFKYLISNQVKLTSSIWPFVIHSNNIELVQILMEKKVSFIKNAQKYQNPNLKHIKLPHLATQFYMTEKAIKKLLIESIKCHHIEVFNYLKENLVNKQNNINWDADYKYKEFVVDGDKDLYPFIFKSFNYICLPSEIDDLTFLYYSCAYDYSLLVDLFLKKEDIDINAIIISKAFFFNEI